VGLRCSAPDEKTKRRQYARENAERYRSHTRNRRAKHKAADGTHTQADIRELYRLQKGRCAYCSIKLDRWHVDHKKPISKGGENGIENLQLTCPTCNLKKSDKDPEAFAREIGRLI
jgi:5-methylcytosine-specific restriction endonuclease McrA